MVQKHKDNHGFASQKCHWSPIGPPITAVLPRDYRGTTAGLGLPILDWSLPWAHLAGAKCQTPVQPPVRMAGVAKIDDSSNEIMRKRCACNHLHTKTHMSKQMVTQLDGMRGAPASLQDVQQGCASETAALYLEQPI